MRKTIIVLMLLMVAMVYAEGDVATGIGKGDGSVDAPEAKGMVDAGNPDAPKPELINAPDKGQMVGTGNKGEAIDKEEIQARIFDMKREMEQKQEMVKTQTKDESEKKQTMLQNHNEVRLAVQSMLQMKEMMGGIGPQVSEIAKQFNNSYMAQAKAEEKISERGGLSRFFAGGDHTAAKEIEAQKEQIQAKIQEMKQAMEQAQTDDQIKTMMQQQIQKLEQEQLRLQQVADGEKKSKGLLGWIWK